VEKNSCPSVGVDKQILYPNKRVSQQNKNELACRDSDTTKK